MSEIIEMKPGIALLEKMNLIEFAVQAEIIGDASPLSSTPNQRRNMALVLADVASTLVTLATRIDPLVVPLDDDGLIRWEATCMVMAQQHKPKLFALPANAFEESMERVGTDQFLAESKA